MVTGRLSPGLGFQPDSALSLSFSSRLIFLISSLLLALDGFLKCS
jgi:hypothetical protein